VFQLLSEGSDTLEFSARRRKWILVLRHGVGKCHESFFFQSDKVVDYFTGCEALTGLGRLCHRNRPLRQKKQGCEYQSDVLHEDSLLGEKFCVPIKTVLLKVDFKAR
jgi:hypothetical protein